MSIDGSCACASGNFTRSKNYINKNGDHPKYFYTLSWNRIVFKKEELNDNNWLYIGDESEEEKKLQMEILTMHKGWVPILE